MRKRYASATAILFAVAIMITIPFNGMLPSTAVAQQQRINSNTSSSQSASNPLPLKTIFKQVENSVVQITSKPVFTGDKLSARILQDNVNLYKSVEGRT
jgi:hypothetical protein